MIFRTSSLAYSLGILATLAVLFAGCADSTQPLDTSGDPVVERPRAEFPPVPESAEVYDREGLNSYGPLDRYVLYDDGTFELQVLRYMSPSQRYYAYAGEYVRTGSDLAFAFAVDAYVPWEATGTLEGTRLRVEYNPSMALSGFEDGVYIRSEGHETAEFPPVSGSAEVYDRESPTSFDALSRYVLYGDGTFELQYVSGLWGYFAYPGEYSREGSKLDFAFDADSRWKATATLEGIRLHVEYNMIMVLSDFEVGVYILRDGHSTSP